MAQRQSQIVRMRDLGQFGLNTDAEAWSLPSGYLTGGNNFRVSAGSISTFGGYRREGIELPAALIPAHLLYVNAENDLWVVCGTTNIYSYDGATWLDVTGPALNALPLEWQHTMLGRLPIINNPADHPRVMTPATHGQDFAYLQWEAGVSWSDAGMQCKSIVSFRNFLVAMNMTEGGVVQPDVIRWSHPADSGGLPVSWNDADPQYRANKVVLAGDGGDILGGLPLRDSMAIYRERGTAILDFVGGDYVFRIRSLSSTTTLINTNSIVEVKGEHIFISEGDVVRSDGNAIVSLMHNRLRKRFASDFNDNARDAAFVVHNREFKEVWCCIPVQNSEEADAAWIYNYRDDTWSVRDLPNVVSADYGPLNAAQRTWDNWTQETWDTSVGLWNQGTSTAFDNNVMGVIKAGDEAASLVILDMLNSETVVETYLERISQPIADIHDVVSIQAVYPLIAGVAEVLIQVGFQDHVGGPITWKPAQSFRPSIDRKVDLRATGELISWRIKSVDGGAFTFSGLDLELVSAGWR